MLLGFCCCGPSNLCPTIDHETNYTDPFNGPSIDPDWILSDGGAGWSINAGRLALQTRAFGTEQADRRGTYDPNRHQSVSNEVTVDWSTLPGGGINVTEIGLYLFDIQTIKFVARPRTVENDFLIDIEGVTTLVNTTTPSSGDTLKIQATLNTWDIPNTEITFDLDFLVNASSIHTDSVTIGYGLPGDINFCSYLHGLTGDHGALINPPTFFWDDYSLVTVDLP